MTRTKKLPSAGVHTVTPTGSAMVAALKSRPTRSSRKVSLATGKQVRREVVSDLRAGASDLLAMCEPNEPRQATLSATLAAALAAGDIDRASPAELQQVLANILAHLPQLERDARAYTQLRDALIASEDAGADAEMAKLTEKRRELTRRFDLAIIAAISEAGSPVATLVQLREMLPAAMRPSDRTTYLRDRLQALFLAGQIPAEKLSPRLVRTLSRNPTHGP